MLAEVIEKNPQIGNAIRELDLMLSSATTEVRQYVDQSRELCDRLYPPQLKSSSAPLKGAFLFLRQAYVKEKDGNTYGVTLDVIGLLEEFGVTINPETTRKWFRE